MICTLLNAIQISETALVKFEEMMTGPRDRKGSPILIDLMVASWEATTLEKKDTKNRGLYSAIACVIGKMGDHYDMYFNKSG